jgi:hypothetical protein
MLTERLGRAITMAVLAGVTLAAQAPSTTSLQAWQWRVTAEDRTPLWAALPPQGRIRTSPGLRLEAYRSSGITYENLKLGVLVGALKNVGRCATDLRVFLQYTDDRWRPVGDPIESEARVSRVEPDGVLPFRFRLASNDAFAAPPSGFSLHVHEQGRALPDEYRAIVPLERPAVPVATPCTPITPVVTATVTRMSTTRTDGFSARGEVRWEGASLREDALTLTAVVFDAADEVLEVLTGTPDPATASSSSQEGRQVRRFTLTSPVPVGRRAARAVVHVDILDAPQAR